MAGLRAVPMGRLVALARRWTHCERWTPVEGQTTYTWDTGTVTSDSTGTGDADTIALRALVQWGPLTLVPDLDYSIEADGLVLTSAPSAEQAASSQPLVVRVFRATSSS